MDQKRHVITLLPQMVYDAGHYYSYHLQASKAVASLGWDYIVLTRLEAKSGYWPDHWKRWFTVPKLSKRIPKPIRYWGEKYIAYAEVRKALRDHLDKEGPNTIFLEDPSPFFLQSLVHSLIRCRRKAITVWLHCHLLPSDKQWVNTRLRLQLWALSKLLPPGHLLLSSMTIPLAKRWEKAIGLPVSTIPLPLGPIQDVPPFPRNEETVLCWYAGPAYAWKGQEHIQTLLDSRHPDTDKLSILFSEEWPLIEGMGNIRAKRLPGALDRKDYLRWLRTVDLVLLPYSAAHGRDVQLSSIFVEAVLAGKIPVVKEGTWMADELRNCGLERLVVDWTNPQLPANLVAIHKDKEIHNKVAHLSAQYNAYHCTDGYAAWMLDAHQRIAHA